MIFEIDGLKIMMTDVGDRMVLHVMNGRGYEGESLDAWSKLIVPGTVALDIGAYTGLFSIVAAMRGATAVAFEPMPANRWRLAINIALNKVGVQVMPIAVSDYTGLAELHYNPNVELTTGASLEWGLTDKHTKRLSVACSTVDALDFKNVGAIKIDVERHEASVISGALQTIRRDQPKLLIETLDDAMRGSISRLLPEYSIAAVLDKRNTLFTPD